MTNSLYSKAHIAELSAKLQKDVDVILEDFLVYVKDERSHENFHTHINVDMVLKTEIPKKHTQSLTRNRHTYQKPMHIDAQMNPVHSHNHSAHPHKKDKSIFGKVTQNIFGIA